MNDETRRAMEVIKDVDFGLTLTNSPIGWVEEDTGAPIAYHFHQTERLDIKEAMSKGATPVHEWHCLSVDGLRAACHKASDMPQNKFFCLLAGLSVWTKLQWQQMMRHLQGNWDAWPPQSLDGLPQVENAQSLLLSDQELRSCLPGSIASAFPIARITNLRSAIRKHLNTPQLRKMVAQEQAPHYHFLGSTNDATEFLLDRYIEQNVIGSLAMKADQDMNLTFFESCRYQLFKKA